MFLFLALKPCACFTSVTLIPKCHEPSLRSLVASDVVWGWSSGEEELIDDQAWFMGDWDQSGSGLWQAVNVSKEPLSYCFVLRAWNWLVECGLMLNLQFSYYAFSLRWKTASLYPPQLQFLTIYKKGNIRKDLHLPLMCIFSTAASLGQLLVFLASLMKKVKQNLFVALYRLKKLAYMHK